LRLVRHRGARQGEDCRSGDHRPSAPIPNRQGRSPCHKPDRSTCRSWFSRQPSCLSCCNRLNTESCVPGEDGRSAIPAEAGEISRHLNLVRAGLSIPCRSGGRNRPASTSLHRSLPGARAGRAAVEAHGRALGDAVGVAGAGRGEGSASVSALAASPSLPTKRGSQFVVPSRRKRMSA
jgi:hypothetical protein